MSLIAVIDVETTGLNPYRHDRVVEIAALLMQADETVVRHFTSLLNPDRDIGPTRIHGLVSRDVIAAPRFGDIAGSLLASLDGAVAIAGHNVRFDHSFLSAELHRLGFQLPNTRTLCTMQLAGGGNLVCACADYGIPLEGAAHCAWYDAMATTKLLASLLRDAPRLTTELFRLQPISWPALPVSSAKPLTRDESRNLQSEPPTYLQSLLAQVPPGVAGDTDESAISAYAGLLDRVLEDRVIDEGEGTALSEVAQRWGLSAVQIQQIHFDFLRRLAEVAVADGVVTDVERGDLQQVALLLGIDAATLAKALAIAARSRKQLPDTHSAVDAGIGQEDLSGKLVCFTGECRCRLNGEPLTRSLASDIAARHGMSVEERVTTNLDLLVVADPLSQSGKAKTARRYGIRIVYEPVFWRMLGMEIE